MWFQLGDGYFDYWLFTSLDERVVNETRSHNLTALLILPFHEQQRYHNQILDLPPPWRQCQRRRRARVVHGRSSRGRCGRRVGT